MSFAAKGGKSIYKIKDKQTPHTVLQKLSPFKEIDKTFTKVKEILLFCTDDYSCERERTYKIVPRWNQYVKEHYINAKEGFLEWKEKGKPTAGNFLENMKNTRNRFKTALEYCKTNEQAIRNQNTVRSLMTKDFKELWKEVYRIKNINTGIKLLSTTVDGENDLKAIANCHLTIA